MTGWKQDVYRKTVGVCPRCGVGEVKYVLCTVCDVCHMILYLEWRHAVDWPLDESDKIRLGLAPQPEKPGCCQTVADGHRYGCQLR